MHLIATLFVMDWDSDGPSRDCADFDGSVVRMIYIGHGRFVGPVDVLAVHIRADGLVCLDSSRVVGHYGRTYNKLSLSGYITGKAFADIHGIHWCVACTRIALGIPSWSGCLCRLAHKPFNIKLPRRGVDVTISHMDQALVVLAVVKKSRMIMCPQVLIGKEER